MPYIVQVRLLVSDQLEIEADSSAEAHLIAKEAIEELLGEVEDVIMNSLSEYNSQAEMQVVEIGIPEDL